MNTPLPAGIHSSDLVQLLRSEGFDRVHAWTLRYAAKRCRIPRPFTTASGDHAWRVDDLPTIRRYLQSPVKPGRPRKVPE